MANISKAYLDATNKKIVLEVVDDDSGLAAGSFGSVEIKLGASGGTPTSPGTAMGMTITLRETKGCDDAGDPVYCMMLRSEWYTTPLTADPET